MVQFKTDYNALLAIAVIFNIISKGHLLKAKHVKLAERTACASAIVS